jgi:biotin operon repressor
MITCRHCDKVLSHANTSGNCAEHSKPNPAQTALLKILSDGEWHSRDKLRAALNVQNSRLSHLMNRIQERGTAIESRRAGYLIENRIKPLVPDEYRDWMRDIMADGEFSQAEAVAFIEDHIAVMERRKARVG